MEFLEPVHGVCNEEVLDFVASEVKDVGAPVRVFALARVGVFVTGGAVETSECMCVLGEVCRNPVENHADFVLVAEINKVAELVGRAVAARGRVVTRDLVAPGFVERMFCNRQKFNVRVAHFLEVGDEAFCKFVPIEESVRVCWVAAPGTGVDFVNVHRGTEDLCRPVRFHVKIVAPFITVEVRRDGGCCRTDFCKFCERVDFDVQVAVGTVNFKAVEFAFAEIRNEDFPNAGAAEHAHLMAAAVPAVEVTDDGNSVRVRCPNCKVDALESLMLDDVRAKLAVEFVMGARRNQVAVKFRENWHECVWIHNGVFVSVFLPNDELIEERLEFHVQNGFEKSCVAKLYEIEFFGAVARFTADIARLRLVGANDGLDAFISFERVEA